MAKQQALSIIELQNLRTDVERLLSGEKALKELIFEIKNMFLPNRYLPNFILEKAGINMGNQYGYGLAYQLHFSNDPLKVIPERPEGLITYMFEQPSAILGISYLGELLDDRTMRKHVLDHLVYAWKPGYKEWLAEFVNRLEGRALMHLLLEPALKETGKLSTLELRKDILLLVGEKKIAEVIQAAESARKLVPLYELTRWPGCQGRGGLLDRKNMLSVDMEL